jgi:cellobiose-specific phosphotransferase system component IIC
MSTFYRQLRRQDEAAAWFSFALAMGGAGLVLGLINTLLYFKVSKSYRSICKLAKARFNRDF